MYAQLSAISGLIYETINVTILISAHKKIPCVIKIVNHCLVFFVSQNLHLRWLYLLFRIHSLQAILCSFDSTQFNNLSINLFFVQTLQSIKNKDEIFCFRPIGNHF